MYLKLKFTIIIYVTCLNNFLPKGKKRAVKKTNDDSVPLPNPFTLPKHYQRSVEEALESGKMPIKQRRLFLSDIASSMLRYKRYPTRDDYILVACTVIKTYPFMKGTTGRPYVSIVMLLVFLCKTRSIMSHKMHIIL